VTRQRNHNDPRIARAVSEPQGMIAARDPEATFAAWQGEDPIAPLLWRGMFHRSRAIDRCFPARDPVRDGDRLVCGVAYRDRDIIAPRRLGVLLLSARKGELPAGAQARRRGARGMSTHVAGDDPRRVTRVAARVLGDA